MNKALILLTCFILSLTTYSQNNFPGINYNAVYRDANGSVLANVQIEVRTRINTSGNEIVWEEDHSVLTDNSGYFQCIIGEGVSTGNGIVNDFSSINWGASVYSVSISIDEGFGFIEWGTNSLYSVPYALYAKTAENQLFINNLADVDTSGLMPGDILKWNGLNWIVDAISDTVSYSENSLQSINSVYSDTAFFAYEALNIPLIDTVLFSYYSDSSNYSNSSYHATYSDSSNWADSSLYAFNTSGVWLNNGNEIEGLNAIFGSLDSSDVNFVSNNQNRMTIKANGKIGMGITDPITDFHINNSNGFIAEGVFLQGEFAVVGAGSRMQWIPKKAAFRVGGVSGNAWDEINTGNYSFAGGYNTKAKGDYSFSFGQNSFSNGNHAVSMGFNANASGNTSVSMGSATIATGVSSISIGRGTIAGDSASFAIGYHTESYGKASGAFGFQSIANEDFSYVFGYRAKADHTGCFVFSDASNYGGTQVFTTTTADNQFLVKASGGTYFYSDPDQLSGVFLAPGSGSWSSLSDRNSKENIELVDYLSVLDKVKDLNVYSWNYKTQEDGIRHIGPYAQDIYNAFNYGESDEAISIVDMDGINMASIKALLIKVEYLKLSIQENEVYKVKYMSLLKSFILLEERISSLETISAE